MIDWQNVLAGAAAGGMVGFALVHLVAWLWRPRVRKVRFVLENSNFGTLYKLCFTLRGRSQAGLCALAIEWGQADLRTVFAKWDETPNPLENDDLTAFRPELVPNTFYQPLFLGRPYRVPVLIQSNSAFEIFSGWWFGKDQGYGPDPIVSKSHLIRLTLTGGNFSWSKSLPVPEIVNQAGDPA